MPRKLGGQIGGVSLDHDPVHREPVDDLQGLSGVLVGDGAVNPQIPAPLDKRFRHFGTAGEDSERPPQRRVLQHKGETVAVSLPVVDDNGQAEGLCQLQLAVEHVLLESPGRVVLPVVIQADLSDGPHLGAGGQLPPAPAGSPPPFSAVGGVDPPPRRRHGKIPPPGPPRCGSSPGRSPG